MGDEEIVYTKERASMFSSKMKEELANLKNLSNKVEKQKIEDLLKEVEKLTVINKEYRERIKQLEDKDEEVTIFDDSGFTRHDTKGQLGNLHSSNSEITHLISARNEVSITPVNQSASSTRYLKLKPLSDIM